MSADLYAEDPFAQGTFRAHLAGFKPSELGRREKSRESLDAAESCYWSRSAALSIVLPKNCKQNEEERDQTNHVDPGVAFVRPGKKENGDTV